MAGIGDPFALGLPPDWQPDPAWAPPPHWGYGEQLGAPEIDPTAIIPPPELAPQVDPAAQAFPQASPVDAPAGPPPLPMPDAITGATLNPPPIEPEQLDVAPTTLADQWQRDPLHNPDPTAIDDVVANDPLRFAQLQIDQQQARTAKAAADQIAADEANLRSLKADQEARRMADAATQAKSDAIVADAVALAGTKIDPDRLMSKMSAGQSIAQLFAVVVGGLVAGRTGGPNAGMDLLQKRIDRDIDAQRADIENAKFGINVRKGAVAEEFARTGDLYHAAETVRLATYQATINKMIAEQQNFDPRGTAAIARGKYIQDFRGRQAAAVETQRKTIFDETYKVEQLRLQGQAQADARKHQAQQLGLGYAQLNSAAADRKAAADARKDEKATKRADELSERERQFSVSAPRPALALDDNGKPVTGPDGKPVATTSKLTNKDGTPWLLGDAESTRAMKSKIVAASEIADMIDEVLDIRDKVGGESKLWNSDGAQRLKVLQSRLALVRKGGTQGMSSDKDFENLASSIGADDLTSFRARAAGLKEARERTIGELNTEMRTSNYTGAPIGFPNKYGDATTNTPEDDKRQSLLETPKVSRDDVAHAAIAKRQLGLTPEQLRDPEVYNATIRDGLAEANATYDPGASPAQQEEIARLGQLALGNGPGSDDARKVLDDVASTAHTGKLRALAKQALDQAGRAAVSAAGEPERVR